MIDSFILFILAFIIGLVGAIVGSGGGFLLVPVLLILTDLSPQSIAGTSLAIVILSSFSSTLAYKKQKKVDYYLAKIFIISMIPGTVIGVYINQFITVAEFSFIFGIVLLIISFLLIRNHKINIPYFIPKPIISSRELKYSTGEVQKYEFSVRKSGVISFLVGLLSPVVGIGGGIIRTPLMITIIGIPPKVATATSQIVSLIGCIVAVLLFASNSQIEYFLVILLGVGAILGAQLGAQISKKSKSKNIQFFMGVTVFLVGVCMFLKSFGIV